MKTGSYVQKVKRRIWLLWFSVIGMTVYMILAVELGGGDSRIMTDTAVRFSKLFFPGLAFLLWRIYYNKKLLKDREKMAREQLEQEDERNQYLHDKSGGLPMDILLVLLFLVTWTASLFHMAVFYTCLGLLAAAVLLKMGFYLYYQKGI
ncbi:MAG: hypothetical protein ACOX60_05025 [Massiliimalia sp.]